MNSNPAIGALIKFFTKESYAESFRGGKLRLGQVASFRTQYEQDAGKRHDPAEFADIYNELLDVRVFIEGTDIEVGRGSGLIHARRDLDKQSYIFCMTAVTSQHLLKSKMHHRPHQKLAGFGQHAVIVTNYREFVTRLHRAVRESGKFLPHPDLNEEFVGVVEYVDFKKHRGYLGPLRKSDDYAFQDEWRMVLVDRLANAAAPDHQYLDVGDLSDITISVETGYILNAGFRGRLEPDED